MVGTALTSAQVVKVEMSTFHQTNVFDPPSHASPEGMGNVSWFYDWGKDQVVTDLYSHKQPINWSRPVAQLCFLGNCEVCGFHLKRFIVLTGVIV